MQPMQPFQSWRRQVRKPLRFAVLVGLLVAMVGPWVALPTTDSAPMSLALVRSDAGAKATLPGATTLTADVVLAHAMVEFGIGEFSMAAIAPKVAEAPTVVLPAVSPAPDAPPLNIASGAPAVSRRDAMLAALPVDPAALGFRLAFAGPSSSYSGLTSSVERTITIFVDPAWSDAKLAHVTAHEIGHAVDITLNTAVDRGRWREARGIGNSLYWWATSGTADFAAPSGDFAECFAVWATGDESFSRSQFGPCGSGLSLMAEIASRA